MVLGHYVTALFARQKVPYAPLALLLFCTIMLDFIWLSLVPFGFETLKPDSWLTTSIINLQVAMPYSHNLVPVIGWIILITAIGWAITRNRIIGFWCGGLVLLHWLCDLLVGFKHYVLDTIPPVLGLNLYLTHPYVAFLIEAIFCAAVVTWFVRARRMEGKGLSSTNIVLLYLLFVGGTLSFMPLADHSFAYWLGL